MRYEAQRVYLDTPQELPWVVFDHKKGHALRNISGRVIRFAEEWHAVNLACFMNERVSA